MTLKRADIDTIKASHGAETTLGDEDNAPYGYTLVGALNHIERIAENMDEYGITYSDLSAEKQDELDRAHEALQYHIENLSNVLADGFTKQDDSIELPNGNTVSLPLAATSADQSKDLPSPPS